jgi:nucleolar MIF4G domain-containing protein 1
LNFEQEKGYNPYYALVAQRLCEQAHSYKITAQFCLWDFLRELGEGDVGGAEMLKSRTSEVGFSERGVSKERARNVARLYAWWIAKGSVSLAILKVSSY